MRSESGKQLLQGEVKAAEVVERYQAELQLVTIPILASRRFPPDWLNVAWQEKFAADILREIRAEPPRRMLQISNRMQAILGPQAVYWADDYAASETLPSGNDQRLNWMAANSNIFVDDASTTYLVKTLRESIQRPQVASVDPSSAFENLNNALRDLANFLRRR